MQPVGNFYAMRYRLSSVDYNINVNVESASNERLKSNSRIVNFNVEAKATWNTRRKQIFLLVTLSLQFKRPV